MSERQNNEQYENLLNQLYATDPLIAGVLARAQRNRFQRLSQYSSGARFKGPEELLRLLGTIETSFKLDSRLSNLTFLVARARADFETSIEATLCGLHGIVGDSMRDVMEIEFLFREFHHDPSSRSEWLVADQKTLRNKYRPAVLREKHAKRLQVRQEDLAEAADYKGHSMALHVLPRQFLLGGRGFAEESLPFESDFGFWEIFEHARRLVLTLDAFIGKTAPQAVTWLELEKELPLFGEAYERAMEMQSIFQGLVEAAIKETKTERLEES